MTEENIEIQRAAGEITLILKNGSKQEKESLLNLIENLNGISERKRIEKWIEDGMPGA